MQLEREGQKEKLNKNNLQWYTRSIQCQQWRKFWYGVGGREGKSSHPFTFPLSLLRIRLAAVVSAVRASLLVGVSLMVI